ncbi:DUF1499 domain-containing protein [Amaricoccus macauensis]|uniref:DUF1499 domain-containing protein n=1 Tax=Amaricoccus macauensis TaxID=57001 RepID=UPI003C7A121A
MTSTASRVGTGLLILAVVAALAIALMSFGTRLGFWEPIVGFRLLQTYLVPFGAILSGLGLLGLVAFTVQAEPRAAGKAGITTLIGLAMLAPMLISLTRTPVSYPPIHDITTDTANPPAFLVLDETRPGARNSLEYGGPEVAQMQKAAYPDIAPIETDLAPAEAFDAARETAESMAWEIVAEDAEALRFEATARTALYHFADDLVVVVRPEAEGSRVDLRSVSRIGRGDRGVNAARVRAFIEAYPG